MHTSTNHTSTVNIIFNFWYNIHNLCSGPEYTTVVGGQECTVSKLLEELYQKAAFHNLWSLVRHTAGMLRKSVENLGAVSSWSCPTSSACYGRVCCRPLTHPHTWMWSISRVCGIARTCNKYMHLKNLPPCCKASTEGNIGFVGINFIQCIM